MAGMFYSMKETAARLGTTEDEVRQLARAGKLREFRDGSHVLFKTEEVNALLAEGLGFDLEADLEVAPEPAEAAAPPDGASEDEALNLLEEETPAAESAAEAEASSEFELAAEPEAEASSEFELAAESGGEGTTTADDELFLLSEDDKPAESGADAAAETDDEISLAPETGAPASESDITDMDTALTGEGVNALGETDTGYDATDDSMAETAVPGASAGKTGTGTGSEASLEDIEEDVSLDSFGSGSGLLDLSLQADDTSLGGILDEIYTAEGGEEAPAGAEPGSVEDITAEVEQAGPEEELAAPEAAAAAPVAAAAAYPAYAEAAPDTQSNILGMLLILPLLALLYTAIVALAGQRGVMPSVVSGIRSLIWPIVGGLIVLALLISGASFVMGGEKAPRAAAPKKVKAEKPKKEKAAKAEKTAEKPAKEKKGFSLFGKKKEKK